MQDNVSYISLEVEGNVTVALNHFIFKPPSPINRDLWFIILKLILSSTGIPLNLFMAFAILRLRRFRCKPRNIFLLGISVSDLIACIPPMIEIVDYFFLLPPPENTLQRSGASLVNCQVYIWMRGLPEMFLLLNTFYSLTDKFISIRYHMWHKEKVTVGRATLGLVITFISSGTFMRIHFISGLVPLRCRGDFWTGFTTGVVLLTLFVLCLVSHVLVYIQSRALFNQLNPFEYNASGLPDDHEMIEMNTFPTTRQPVVSNNVTQADHQADEGNRSTSARAKNQQHRRFRRLEKKSTKTLLIEVTALLLIFFPTAVYLFSINLCRLIASNADYSCNSYAWLNTYFKQSGLIHSVYHPVVHLVLHKEEFSIVIFKKKNNSRPSKNKRRNKSFIRRNY